jgi:nicotinate-nucleotide adenylyltransferase
VGGRVSGGGERIGVLGGTFDPPHVGHLWLATLVSDALGLDRVIFMPAAEPPHKLSHEVTDADARVAMTRRAIQDNDRFEVSTIELDRPGPSFTVDSVVQLVALHPAPARLFLVLAADSLAQIGSWREPDRLLSLIEWAVGPRSGVPLGDPSALRTRFGAAAERIHLVDGPALDVSSSQVRARVAAGRSIRYLVPRAVEDLISDQGLYRGAAATRSADPG